MISGMKIYQIHESTFPVDVMIRMAVSQRESLDSKSTLQICTPSGNNIPFMQITSMEYEQEYPLIWRRDPMPTVTLEADVSKMTMSVFFVDKLRPKIFERNSELSVGFHFETSDSSGERAKS